VLDTERALENDGDLLELGTLPRLPPSLRRGHAGDADRVVTRVDAAGELLDLLGLVAGGLDDGRLLDEVGHSQVLRNRQRFE
jgi:hypothetical protein